MTCPRSKGITIIELMIVLAIIGVIASIAYPSYVSQVRKSKRADAINSLLKIQLDQEKYRANKPNYANCVKNEVACTTGTLNWSLSESDRGYYRLYFRTTKVTDPVLGTTQAIDWKTEYIAVAEALAGRDQENDTDCKYIAVNQNGADKNHTFKSDNSTPNSACWSQ